MAGGGWGSNTTHALLSPDPETLPIGEVSRPATGEFLGTKRLQGQPTVAPHAPSSRPDPPEVGTRQLTLCPSSTNSLEPSPNLVPSEVPASGQHGFVKWGHDAKITKIGVSPTHGSPGQGKANGSQVRRQDL